MFSLLILTSCIGDTKIIKYSDINLYIEKNYCELSDNDIYKITSKNCDNFLPKYDDFEYKEFVNGFYVFDGSATYTHASISFVLELQFDNIKTYEKFLTYENNRCEYTNEFNIKKNGYLCYVTTNDTLTYYHYETNIPFQFGMLCENQEVLSIRYVYFRECESSVDKKFDVVFKNTNCNW